MFLLLRRQNLGLKDIGYQGSFTPFTIIVILLFFVIGIVSGFGVGILLDYLGIFWISSGLVVFQAGLGIVEIGLLIFTLLVTAPVIEETFYRAYSITALSGRVQNRLDAGLMSCIMFALVYLPFWGVRGAIQLFLWALLPMTLFIWRKGIILV